MECIRGPGTEASDPGERLMGAQVSRERGDTAVRPGLTPGHYHIITHSDTRSHAPEPGVTGAGHTGLCYTNSPEAGQVSIMYPELRPEP